METSTGSQGMDQSAEDPSITAITSEIIAGYRIYFALLWNYQEDNHEKIMAQLRQTRDLERRLREATGDKQAASKLFYECYQTVLNENPWAKTDFWSDR
jgi:hypothetical protein